MGAENIFASGDMSAEFEKTASSDKAVAPQPMDDPGIGKLAQEQFDFNKIV